jgi:hypothetical protein
MFVRKCSLFCKGKDGEIPEEDAATLAVDFDVGFAIKEKVLMINAAA